jgi:hypothetical protein
VTDRHFGESVTSVPIAVQFWHRIIAATVQREELRSLRLVGTSLSTEASNIAATIRIASGALLSPNECLVHALHQLRRTLKLKKTLVVVVAGLIGLIFIFFLLEISVRGELPNQASDAAIDGLPAAPATPQQIEFADRFAIQSTNSSPFEAVQVGAPGATSSSEDTGTFGQVFREPVPLPRPRKRR